MMPSEFIIQIDEGWHFFQVSSAIWAFIDWSYASGEAYTRFVFPDPYLLLNSFFYAFFSYVFLIQIIRHHQEKTTRKNVRISAVLTLFPLLPLLILSLFGVSLYAGGGLTGPIPLFLILGLVIDHYWGIEPAVQPWDE
jgi:hypothetical protein